MKIRYLSDIHLDVNDDDFSLDGDMFTVIAGDISGDPEEVIRWVKKNVKRGIFVEGNHILYNDKYSLQDSYKMLKEAFPIDSDVSFLQNETKVIDGITFFGATLWTDFDLYNNQVPAMLVASQCMNDYKWGVYDGRRINVSDTSWEHFKSRSILQTLQNAIIVTHHAPSVLAIPREYQLNETNPAYASNLDYIAEDQNVWIFGHIHSPNKFKIGKCLCVSNPKGYKIRHENPSFDPNTFIEVDNEGRVISESD